MLAFGERIGQIAVLDHSIFCSSQRPIKDSFMRDMEGHQSSTDIFWRTTVQMRTWWWMMLKLKIRVADWIQLRRNPFLSPICQRNLRGWHVFSWRDQFDNSLTLLQTSHSSTQYIPSNSDRNNHVKMSQEEKQKFLDGNDTELGERQGNGSFARPPSPRPMVSKKESPLPPVLAYCASSIMMTVANKYILAFPGFNLNFFLLAVQVSLFCTITFMSDSIRLLSVFQSSLLVKEQDWSPSETSNGMKVENVRTFAWHKARLTAAGFPISLFFIGMIYTSTWALKFLPINVYTIFKNLTIILIAYGEVLWFGGSVGPMVLFSFGLMVFSSIIAAWADIQTALTSHATTTTTTTAASQLADLNAGYFWMLANCLSTAAYVLFMRKRITLFNFKDFDSKSVEMYRTLLTNASNVLQ